MFYFLEIYYRSFFYLFFNILFFSILYLYKEILIWSIVFPFMFVNLNKNLSQHFIYTHPTEIFNIIFYLIFSFCLIMNLIYIVLMLLDFFKTSIIKTKVFFFQKSSCYIFLLILIFNVFFIIYIIPFLFCFLESYNNTDKVNLNLVREFRIESYVKFFIETLILSNFLFYFVIFLLILIFSFNFLFFLKNKKFFMFINIVLSTLFSPPDVFSQLTLFFLLSVLIELFILILLFKIKFNIVTY